VLAPPRRNFRLPQAGSFAMVARLARLMRLTRLISRVPEPRLIVGTMIRSIPSMGHVIVLLSLLLYVYAVIGFHFFREASPAHWGTLGAALLTLFQRLTLEGWVEVQGNRSRLCGNVWVSWRTGCVLCDDRD
jgi:voltage-gated sodium channel